MKKYFFIPLFIFLHLANYSLAQQNAYSQGEMMKVQLLEKFNLPARDLPKLLIKAYCEGQIQGYFPLRVDSVCSYYEFMNQFAFGTVPIIPTPEQLKRVNSPNCCPSNITKCPVHCFPPILTCPQNYCDYSNDADIEKFMQNYDIIQQKRFDKTRSMEVYDIKYIRLVYVVEKYGQKFNVLGPVFKYDDVIALNPEVYKLMNPKNDAANVSFKQYFASRMFHATVIKTSGINSTNPDAVEQREKGVWEK